MTTDPTWFSAARTFLDALEDTRLVAYRCPAGVWTIGTGLTRLNGKPIRPGQRITQAEADAGLDYELRQTEATLARLVRVPRSGGESTALTSFTFNLGAGTLASSTLLRKLNAGDRAGAAAEFLRWDKATVNGVLVQMRGLHNRRLREQAMFLGRPLEIALACAATDDDWSDVA